MKYRKLGRSGIDVSEICLGSMTWGEQNTEQEGCAQMDFAVEKGVNFFDVAEMYSVPPRPETFGRSEEIMGNWLANRGARDQLVLASKVTGRSERNSGVDHIRNGARLSRDQIFSAINGSLKRLKTDYLDLYQVHWPERQTNFFGVLGYEHGNDDGVSIEETLSALHELVEQGKVRHIGISNETPWGISEYLRIAKEKGWSRVVSIQNPYNLLNRTFEVGCSEFSIREQVGLLAYSPLAFGVLTGKYLHGAQPEGARLTLYDRFTRYGKANVEDAIGAYVCLARDHALNPAQMALAYVNSRDFVTSNIVGATSVEQLACNLESVELTLSDEVIVAIEAIHQRYPNPSP
ncbi:NADP(H)-dependent aldo-keto reductase [Teredinibacter purpureus]|uniref:NADP(H)-dependent aldo-keto reductase n=1 Tax=Teredinibacter purpureus TaxID=2731756 RepID=UPI0005F85E13|nr:NADP(H)-dependent aldo-keto reductase [Teredinibacter purpureus]